MTNAWAPLPLTMSESDFQDVVVKTARWLGWHVVHFRPAMVRTGKYVTPVQGMPGSPDLLMARDERVLLVELKRHGAYPSPAQRSWLAAIGPEIGKLWKPTDWNSGAIRAELTKG